MYNDALIAIQIHYTSYFVGFPTELTRKHVADMFLLAELENEARRTDTTRLTTWRFHADDDKEKYFEEVIEHSLSSLYSHNQSTNCPDIGMCFSISE